MADQDETKVRAPVVRVGSDIRIQVGDGKDDMPETTARRIEMKLSFRNPALRKLRNRIASGLRSFKTLDESYMRAMTSKLFKAAREDELDYGEMVGHVKAVAFGSPTVKVTDEKDKARVKRLAGTMFAASKADENVWACRREDDTLIIPRGALPWCYSLFKDVVYDEQRVKGADVEFKWRGPEPRQYQTDAVDFTYHRDGITVMPCGGGKTLTALATVARVGRRTVVLVPTKVIRDEWTSEIWKCLGIAPGHVGDGKFEPDPKITIVINASATRLDSEKFDAVFGNAGILIVDECHHVVSPGLRSVVERVSAMFKWGLTATPFREDGLGKVMEWILGPVVSEATQRELAAQGFLVLPEVKVIRSEWECPHGVDFSDDWADAIDTLVRDVARNETVGTVVFEASQKHTRILVLTCRTWHAHHLGDGLRFGCRQLMSDAVTSEVKKKEQRRIMDEFRNGQLQIVCAVNIADEGLNVPALDAVVIAGPVKARGKTIQRLGRLMRPVDGKNPVLYDIVDDNVPQLKRQWMARRKAYREVLGG